MPAVTYQPRSVFSLAGRVGGLRRAALHDGEAMTRQARDSFRASFETGHGCSVCPRIDIPAGLPAEERRRRGEALRRAHYSAVAMASARSRAKKRTARPAKTSGSKEERDAARASDA